jgi:hypothetical protein
MPGLAPGIHAEPKGAAPELFVRRRRVDGRDKPGHDDQRLRASQIMTVALRFAREIIRFAAQSNVSQRRLRNACETKRFASETLSR